VAAQRRRMSEFGGYWVLEADGAITALRLLDAHAEIMLLFDLLPYATPARPSPQYHFSAALWTCRQQAPGPQWKPA